MVKKTFKILLLRNQKADDLGTWYVALGPTKFVQMMIHGRKLLKVKVKFAS